MQMTIKAMRVDRGLSVKEVSEKTGYKKATLWRWEKGISEPPLSKLAVLLELYGFRFEDVKV